jgi:hypothetical protein
MRRPVSVKLFCSFCFFLLSVSCPHIQPGRAFPRSALFVERCSLGASWAYSFQQVLLLDNRPRLPFHSRGVGPGLSRSHLNSAVELGCLDRNSSLSRPLRAWFSGYCAAARIRLQSPTTDAAVPLAFSLENIFRRLRSILESPCALVSPI